MSGYRPADRAAPTRLVDLLRDGDRILLATGPSEPTELIEELLAAADQRGFGLELLQVMTGSRERILSASPRHAVRPIVPGRGRPEHPDRTEVLPMSMMQVLRCIASGELRIDGVLFSGRQLDGHRVNLGICVDVLAEAGKHARFRAVEINAGLPLVPSPSVLDLDSCEYVVRTRRDPLPLPAAPCTPVAAAIGAHIAGLVQDGSAVELGIGRALVGVADALIAEKRSIAVHSGLLSDWTRTLVESGVAERRLPCADPAAASGVNVAKEVVAVGTVAMGSADFYTWLDERSSVELVESRHAHDPNHLAGLGSFVAINAGSRVDCSGQMGAEGDVAARMAVGGLLDFAVAGTYGGLSIVAVESVDSRGRSRIVPRLSTVQLPGSLVTHVVTKYGVARLSARTWSQRMGELIAVAHPDHRAGLRRAMAG